MYSRKNKDKETCTNIDFVAEACTERICRRWKQSINVTHTADFELLRFPLNHFSVIYSKHVTFTLQINQSISVF